MRFAEILPEIIIDPEQGLNEVLVSAKPLLTAIIIVGAGLFCLVVSSLLLSAYQANLVAGMLISRFLAGLLCFSVFWLLLTAVFHFIASWHQSEGSSHHLFVLFGSSLAPLLFLPAAAILARTLGPGGRFVFFLAIMAIFIWILCLQVISLKLIYHWPTGKAVLVYIMPFITTFIFLFISVIMLIFLTVILIVGNM